MSQILINASQFASAGEQLIIPPARAHLKNASLLRKAQAPSQLVSAIDNLRRFDFEELREKRAWHLPAGRLIIAFLRRIGVVG